MDVITHRAEPGLKHWSLVLKVKEHGEEKRVRAREFHPTPSGANKEETSQGGSGYRDNCTAIPEKFPEQRRYAYQIEVIQEPPKTVIKMESIWRINEMVFSEWQAPELKKEKGNVTAQLRPIVKVHIGVESVLRILPMLIGEHCLVPGEHLVRRRRARHLEQARTLLPSRIDSAEQAVENDLHPVEREDRQRGETK